MISLKSFISAIQEAIAQASDSLMDKNIGLLDRYFSPSGKPAPGLDGSKSLEPKTVSLEYSSLDENLQPVQHTVQVPLLTLVPMTSTRIEKAVLTANFAMSLTDGEVQIEFSRSASQGWFSKTKSTMARLEITLSPQDSPEGLNAIVEGYEKTLKARIP